MSSRQPSILPISQPPPPPPTQSSLSPINVINTIISWFSDFYQETLFKGINNPEIPPMLLMRISPSNNKLMWFICKGWCILAVFGFFETLSFHFFQKIFFPAGIINRSSVIWFGIFIVSFSAIAIVPMRMLFSISRAKCHKFAGIIVCIFAFWQKNEFLKLIKIGLLVWYGLGVQRVVIRVYLPMYVAMFVVSCVKVFNAGFDGYHVLDGLSEIFMATAIQMSIAASAIDIIPSEPRNFYNLTVGNARRIDLIISALICVVPSFLCLFLKFTPPLRMEDTIAEEYSVINENAVYDDEEFEDAQEDFDDEDNLHEFRDASSEELEPR